MRNGFLHLSQKIERPIASKNMAPTEVYYAKSIRDFLMKGGYSHPQHLWAVNFEKMCKDCIRSVGKCTVPGFVGTFLVSSGDRDWVVKILKELTIKTPRHGSVPMCFHILEMVLAIEKNPRQDFSAIMNLVTIYRAVSMDDIPTFEESFEDTRVYALSQVDELQRTLKVKEDEVAMLRKAILDDDSVLISRYRSMMSTLETENERLRLARDAIEKKMLKAVAIYELNKSNGIWYVYKIPETQDVTELKFRGGKLAIDEIAELSGDEMYYLTTDVDYRYGDVPYATLTPWPDVFVNRLSFIDVTIRRKTCRHVIVKLSNTSYISSIDPRRVTVDMI